MRFVLDASATMPWFFRDEATAATVELLTRAQENETISVPAHWAVEVLITLLQAARRGRIKSRDVDNALANLTQLRLVVDRSMVSGLFNIGNLAERHRLTACDAAYLDPALRRSLPLATLDGDLRQAATAERVPLLL